MHIAQNQDEWPVVHARNFFFQIIDIDLDDSVQSGTADQPIPQNVNDPPEVR